jgi:hypothetical protein
MALQVFGRKVGLGGTTAAEILPEIPGVIHILGIIGRAVVKGIAKPIAEIGFLNKSGCQISLVVAEAREARMRRATVLARMSEMGMRCATGTKAHATGPDLAAMKSAAVASGMGPGHAAVISPATSAAVKSATAGMAFAAASAAVKSATATAMASAAATAATMAAASATTASATASAMAASTTTAATAAAATAATATAAVTSATAASSVTG